MEKTNTTVALGNDLFHRFPYLEFDSGYVSFIPAQSMRDIFPTTKAPFSPGSSLEYRIQMGDELFAGDGSQRLESSLWVVESGGQRHLLARGFILYINRRKAAFNLKGVGVPFKVIKAYDGPSGEHVESEVPIDTSRSRLPSALLAGTSSLWVGAVTGLLVHGLWHILIVGTLSFMTIALVMICSSASKRQAIIRTLTLLPSYAAAFVVAVVVTQHLLKR